MNFNTTQFFFAPTKGDPIPPPNAQIIFPERTANTEPFIKGCFLHLPRDNGERLRLLLRRALNSPWWHQQTDCGTELDHFGTRHGAGKFECHFCTSLFRTQADLKKCIKAHIRY